MIAAVTLFSAQAAFAAAGDLDTTFSHDGRVLLHEAAVGVQVQRDGMALVVDLTGAVRRFSPSGLLDRTYGDGTGVAQTGILAVKAVIQPNGALLVLGSVEGTVPQVALVRLTPDGSPDATFDGDGRLVRTSLPAIDPSGVALGPSGRIYVTGTTGSYAEPRIAVAAYTSVGRPLTKFGDDGFVRRGYHGMPAAAGAIDVQTDGRVVVAGWFFQEPPESDAGNRAMGVMRLTTAGTLDRSFGQGGTTVLTFPYRVGGSASSVIVRSTGEVYVSGTEITHDELVPTVVLARLNADGEVQMRVADGSRAQAQSMALQGSKVWIVGTYQVVDPPVWQVERYTADGVLDVRVTEDFEGDLARNASSATIWGGKLYVAGTVDRQLGDVWFHGGVARFSVS